jgi:hypothetical protein
MSTPKNATINMRTSLVPNVDFFFIQFFLEKSPDEKRRYEHGHLLKPNKVSYERGGLLHIYPNVTNGFYKATVFLLDKDFRCVALGEDSLEYTSKRYGFERTVIVEELVKNPFRITVSDFELEDKTRRKAGRSSLRRRALVHDFGDGLTLNWNKDYPGGLTFNGNAVFKDETIFNKSSIFLDSVDFDKLLRVKEDITLRTNRNAFSAPQIGKEGRIDTNLPVPLPEIADISLKEILIKFNNRIIELEQKVAQLSQP